MKRLLIAVVVAATALLGALAPAVAKAPPPKPSCSVIATGDGTASISLVASVVLPSGKSTTTFTVNGVAQAGLSFTSSDPGTYTGTVTVLRNDGALVCSASASATVVNAETFYTCSIDSVTSNGDGTFEVSWSANTNDANLVEIFVGGENGLSENQVGDSVTGPQSGALTFTPDPADTMAVVSVYHDGNDQNTESPTCFDMEALPTTSLTVGISPLSTGTGTVTGTGIACPGDCDEAYVIGSSITLTATPDEGSTFTRWFGVFCAEGDSFHTTCTVHMTEPQNAEAGFQAV